jgi:amidase
MDAADLMFAGIGRQAELLRSNAISATELVRASLDRIAQLDPQLNAFRAVLADQALLEAEQADARRRAGEDRPLLGVPLAIKDDMALTGQRRMLGSSAVDTAQTTDGVVAERLRAAGAIPIGLTHVPELTILPVTESPSWGATRNPWDVHRTPGGSSGGSAAAVAAGMVGAALGSDGGGSIRIPAGCCGLVGLKPQRGRVPTAPVVAPWHGLSTWGPLARRVEDLALFLDAVKDDPEPWSAAVASPPQRLTIAVSLGVPQPITAKPDAEQRGAVERMTATLRDLGHTVIEREIDYGTAMLRFTARYLRGIHDAAGELVEYPERLSRRTRGYMRQGGLIPAGVVAKARAAAAQDAARTDAVFEGGVDVAMTPMFTRRPVPVGEWEGRGATWTFNGNGRWVPYCAHFNHTGHPAMAVPAGLTPDRFPLAVQFIGRRRREADLLALAAQLQQAIGWPDERPAMARA